MVKFTAAGYVCIDYYPDFDNRCYVTGNGVDVLFNLLDMRDDVASSIVSAVSDDDYGKMSLNAFKERGIDCSHLEIIPGGQTPRVPLHLINNDHTDFTGRLIPRLEEIRKRGVKVFFDLSNAVNHPDTKYVLSNIDCGLVSFEDNLEEGKEFLKYACSLGTKLMIATFGKNGSIAYDGSKFYKGDIVPVENVVNTVGAGDSYFAGFIAALIDEKPILDCMHSGAERAAQVISVFDPYLTK